jgi:arsenate reductase
MPVSSTLASARDAIPASLLDAAAQLSERYAGVFSPATVLYTVYESHRLFAATTDPAADGASYAVRFAADWLADTAREQRVVGSDRTRVLFVSGRDAPRARLAAALLGRLGGGRVIATSAVGSTESALDLAVRGAHYVITMGSGDICPLYLGKRYLNWRVGHAAPVGSQPPAAASPPLPESAERLEALVGGLIAELSRPARSQPALMPPA